MRKRWYIAHDRNTRYREIDAGSLILVYIYANANFGNNYGPLPQPKNAYPQSTYKVFDDLRDMRRLFPNIRFSGLAEVPYDKEEVLLSRAFDMEASK